MSTFSYSTDHVWVHMHEGHANIGISDFAQQELGDIVYVELPAVGRVVSQNEVVAVVESVKAASDIITPLSGEIISVNLSLNDAPERINESPNKEGWLVVLMPAKLDELAMLMSSDAYLNYIK